MALNDVLLASLWHLRGLQLGTGAKTPQTRDGLLFFSDRSLSLSLSLSFARTVASLIHLVLC